MLKITPLERAQIILESLVNHSPAEYITALDTIRGLTNKPGLLGHPIVRAVTDALPQNPQLLLKELLGHLKAIQINNCPLDDYDALEKVLQNLPSVASASSRRRSQKTGDKLSGNCSLNSKRRNLCKSHNPLSNPTL